MNAYNQQDSNIRKTYLLMATFLIVVIFIGWAFSWVFGNANILYFAVIFSILMNFFSYWFSDKIVLKMSGAKPVSKDSHREIYNLTENLCIASGLPLPKIYVIDDPAPNAFATGRNPDNSAVAVTTGLLEMLDKSELEGVIAHELSHIKNRDILIGTIVVVLVGFVTLLADFFLRMTIFGGLNSEERDSRVQIIMIIVGVTLSILAPIFATLIQLAVSRKREFLADASGALMTRYPDGLASALKKISSYSGDMKRANRATAHMYISSPFGSKNNRGVDDKKKSGFFAKLFMTHPPVEERINALVGGGIE